MHGKTPEKFKTGDKIQNINKDCEHYKSTGTVKKVKNLPEIGSKDVKSKHNTPGQVVEYPVDNDGKTYEKGNKLTKTEIQLKKIKEKKKKIVKFKDFFQGVGSPRRADTRDRDYSGFSNKYGSYRNS